MPLFDSEKRVSRFPNAHSTSSRLIPSTIASYCARDTKFAGVVGAAAAAGGGGAGSQPVITPNAANPSATIPNLPFIPITGKLAGRTAKWPTNIEIPSDRGARGTVLATPMTERLGDHAARRLTPCCMGPNKTQTYIRCETSADL